VSIDPRLERSILAELALRERRARRQAASHERARALAERLHRGRHQLLAHLHRVASAVPNRFRSVAWLHHAHEAAVTQHELTAAGLTDAELRAIELVAHADRGAPENLRLNRVRAIAEARGPASSLARVVAHAAIKDWLSGARPTCEALTALRLLGDPGLHR
jgi:hypothetical protein